MVHARMPLKAWAIKDRKTNKLVIFDARCPVYWLRRIAREEAQRRGFTTIGSDSDVVIVRVVVNGAR